jgi:hypothetical protein
MRSPNGRLGCLSTICTLAVGAALIAAPAQAATDVYPAGKGTFTGGPQGWQTTAASCNIAAPICTAEGAYDGANGSPAGSYAASTTIALNLLTLFSSTVTVQSPDFTVAAAGDGTLHLDRQLVGGGLVDLAPQASYAVKLLDRTAGTETEVMTEAVQPGDAFVGKDQAVSVKAGHTIAIAITVTTSSTLVGAGLLGGTTSFRFDNLSLTVQSSGGGAGGGGEAGGGDALTNAQLQSLIAGNASLVGPAVLKGDRITVKVRCPKMVGRTCKVALVGLLKKGKPATTGRKAAIRKGKAKKLVLKVKPKALPKVKARKKLLFKQNVRAGKARAVLYKRLKLVKR